VTQRRLGLLSTATINDEILTGAREVDAAR
jgi:hypothetical protein